MIQMTAPNFKNNIVLLSEVMKNEELSDLELPRIELTENMIVDVPPTPEDEQRLKTINELAKQME